jgi:hypothetical protein
MNLIEGHVSWFPYIIRDDAECKRNAIGIRYTPEVIVAVFPSIICREDEDIGMWIAVSVRKCSELIGRRERNIFPASFIARRCFICDRKRSLVTERLRVIRASEVIGSRT